MTRTFFVRKKKEYIQMQKEEKKSGCRKTDRQLNIFSAFFALPTKILPMMCFCNNSFDLCLMNFFLYYLSGSSQILYLKICAAALLRWHPKKFCRKRFLQTTMARWKVAAYDENENYFCIPLFLYKGCTIFSKISPPILFSFFVSFSFTNLL